MKITYIVNRAPCPPEDGTPLRLFNIGKGLLQAGEVKIVVICDTPVSETAKNETRSLFSDALFFDGLDRATLANRRESEKWGGTGTPFPSDLIDKTRAFALDSDLIWVARLSTARRLHLDNRIPTVIDLDDLNQQRCKLASQHSERLKDKLRWKVAYLRCKFRERKAYRQFAQIVVCSEDDKILLKNHDNIQVVPNGFQKPVRTLERNPQNRIGFIGTLEYWANRQGLKWFLNNCWERVHQNHPELKFRIVGRGEDMPEFKMAGVERLGYVDDVSEEWSSWKALVVPLLVGGGTRIKILEAFSRNCPVVSTGIGAYGLGLIPELHFLQADTPDVLVRAITIAVSSPKKMDSLADAAYRLFETKYTWPSVQDKTSAIVKAQGNAW